MNKGTQPSHSEAASPFVSIVLPVYNRDEHIQRSIESLLRQTHQNLEIIVIDDGSTDGTFEKIAALTDRRIRAIALPKNMGANTARNIGIKAASGEWIAFQDSDDEWKPDKLEKQISACLAQQTLVAFSGMNKHTHNRIRYVPKPGYCIQPHAANRLGEVLGARFIGNPTLLVHRDIFSAIGGYDESLQRLQDWELSIRIAVKYPITYINEPLVEAYVLVDSITSRESISRATQQIIEKHFQLFALDRVSLGIQLLSLCLHALAEAQYIKAFRHLSFAIKKCKLQLITAIYRLIKRR